MAMATSSMHAMGTTAAHFAAASDWWFKLKCVMSNLYMVHSAYYYGASSHRAHFQNKLLVS